MSFIYVCFSLKKKKAKKQEQNEKGKRRFKLQNKGEYSGTTGRGVLLDRNKVAQVFNYGEVGGGGGGDMEAL